MKRKKVYLATLLLLIVMLAAGCNNSPSTNEVEGGKIQILVTTFPQYDWVRQIVGNQNENIELSLLVDSGIDLHSFQPSVDDIARISKSDMFIYTGGASDAWVEDALKAAQNKEMIIINLVDVLGEEAKEEELVEGMQHEHADEEAGHDHEDEHKHEDEAANHGHEDEHEHEDEAANHEHEDESETDEHVWLSLRNAQKYVTHLAKDLGELDPTNASTYTKNAEKYNEKLEELDLKFEETVSKSNKRMLLFGDRFPFRYLVDDYGIDYYAAFSGCSAETEASFETIVFLANKVDELGLDYVMTIETSDQSIANTIIKNTKNKNQTILALDSIQSVSSDTITSEISYLSMMESNYDVIKKALE